MAKKVLNVKYDANSVTVEELCSIPRIGKNVAELIVSLQPNLTSIKDLDKKPGLGAKKLETLAQYLTFDKNSKTTEKVETVSSADLLGTEVSAETVEQPVEEKSEVPLAIQEEEQALNSLLDSL